MDESRAPARKPMRPVPRGCAAGFFAGRYKTLPEDFLVEEIPAYSPCGTGEHIWLWVEKRGLSTMQLLQALAQQLRRDEREFGIAGLKDSQAVSRQWVSIEAADLAACEGLKGQGFAVLAVSKHGNKLRMGHLRGNRFVVTLRGANADDLPRAQSNLAELAQRGVPNYFGEQRFGKRGANLQKGLEILAGDAQRYAARMPRRVFGLVLSAVQSEVFNRVVHARLHTLDVLLPGDLAYLHKNGALFPVEDPACEQPRASAFEISPSGPMPGPEMVQPSGEALAIEAKAVAELGVDPAAFGRMPYRIARGERRPLRVPVQAPTAVAVPQGLQLSFGLPRGSYATSVLRELLLETIWFAG